MNNKRFIDRDNRMVVTRVGGGEKERVKEVKHMTMVGDQISGGKHIIKYAYDYYKDVHLKFT